MDKPERIFWVLMLLHLLLVCAAIGLALMNP